MRSPKEIISILLSTACGWGLYKGLDFAKTGMAPALLAALLIVLLMLTLLNAALLKRVQSGTARLLLAAWGIICLATPIVYDRAEAQAGAGQETPRRYSAE